MFHPAFVSCWQELSDEYQDDLVRCLEIALNSVTIPPELVQIILNLAEFMERDGQPLPIDLAKLGLMAENVHAYAKALHYKEQEFLISLQSSLDGLIGLHKSSISQRRRWAHSAGEVARAGDPGQGKLAREVAAWDEALEAYELKALNLRAANSESSSSEASQLDVLMGRMRCLRALGEWDRLSSIATSSFYSHEAASHRREVAPMAAQAAWMRGRFTEMRPFLNEMEEGRFDTEFLRAVLSVHSREYELAEACMRRFLDAELAALVGESYDRAYRVLIQCQQLTELEEVMKVQQSRDPATKDRISEMWRRRLRGCSLNVDVWSAILSVRSLVQSPEDDIQTQIKFSSLCRRSHRMGAALKVFQRLMPEQSLASQDQPLTSSLAMKFPSLTFAYLKHLWHAGLKEIAHLKMFHFLQLINHQKAKREEPLEDQTLASSNGMFEPHSSILALSLLKHSLSSDSRQLSRSQSTTFSSSSTSSVNLVELNLSTTRSSFL